MPDELRFVPAEPIVSDLDCLLLEDLRPGDVVIFRPKARPQASAKIVRVEDGDLYVSTKSGKRWLADETDADGCLIGWERA